MIRVLPYLLELALLVFCLVDAIQTPDAEVRNLPKWAWIILIIIVPLAGGIAWLVAGRPSRVTAGHWQPGSGPPEQTRPPASTSDIDARLDAELARLDREHEEHLKKWESELRAREDKLRDEGEGPKP